LAQIDTITHYLHMNGIRVCVADVSSAAAAAQEIHQLPAATASVMGKNSGRCGCSGHGFQKSRRCVFEMGNEFRRRSVSRRFV